MRRLGMRGPNLGRDRQCPRVDDFIPRLAGSATKLADRRVRPEAKPVKRLDVAAVRPDLRVRRGTMRGSSTCAASSRSEYGSSRPLNVS